MTKCLKCGKLFVFPSPIYANSFAVKKKNTSVLCRYMLKLVMYKGKGIFCTKVLTQRNLCFNGRWNMRCAFWKWAAVPICRKKDGSVMPHSDRRPVNFMLYLGTLHILCLLCRTSFLPLIRWNGKYGTAAQISVISLRNRFEKGESGGPAVTTCRSDFILDLCLTPTLLQRGSEISAAHHCGWTWVEYDCEN